MTPGQKAARWIETFCIYPNGFNKGQFVVLTTEQKEIVRAVKSWLRSQGKFRFPKERIVAYDALDREIPF